MQTSNNDILSDMPVSKAIMKIGIPAISAMLVMAIYNLVDTYFIGLLNDDLALAAVSVAFPIMSMMTAIGQVLGAGSAAALGRALGSDKQEYSHQLVSTTIILSIISGFLFMLMGFIWIEPIFRMFGTTDAVMGHALQYGYWMYVGAIFSIPNQSFNNLARAQTQAILSMKALSIGAISNIILDPIFMFDLNGFGLNMGLEGASLATTVAQAIGFLYIGSHFLRGKTGIPVKLNNFSLKDNILPDIFKSGLPIGVTQMLSVIAVSFTNIAAIQFATSELEGANFQSAYGLVLKINMMFMYSVMGYLQGYQPIASYTYGAKNKERFFEAFNCALKFAVGFTLVMTVTIQLAAGPLIKLFTQNADIIFMGTKLLRYNTILLVCLGLIFFGMLTFQATGNAKQGGIIALSRQGFLYLPILFILCSMMGLEGIYFAQPLADLITAGISISLLLKFRKDLETYFEPTIEDAEVAIN
ncbi:MAG: hypothetical protein ATN36_04785 [Epulopiscium sp. Nele67-Bin005]|nr:MAG: hypothetical protein ATN36_04785 [Epulopiscium sp. Nele67-Bin005]